MHICVQLLKLSVGLALCICLSLAFCVFFCFSSDHFVTVRSELRKVLFLALSVTFLFFFVCESNISETVDQICSKFTQKTCLVPCSEEFECQDK